MRVMQKTLQILKQRQALVDLYRDHLSSESLSGVVTDYSEDFVYLSLFTEAGQANGIAVCFRSDITRIRWEGNERQALSQMIEATGAKPTAPALSLDSLQSVLDSVSATFGYVNVLTERMDDSVTFIGEIAELDAESLLLETFGTYSSRDRSRLWLSLAEITRIDADAAYERSVVYLAGKPA
ncbi:hypothetical protein [Lysobacter sp. Root604]|uniref:hypothetical protein n=2 Tax=unclassified Lysobacter TaxID=2635362 RepID=UPI000B04A695|nr:hypothetical protein [Lysobacter sp. Root604]